MLVFSSLATLLFAQLSSAQVISLGVQNGPVGVPVLQTVNPNVQRTINLPTNGLVLQNNNLNSGYANLNSGNVILGNINSGAVSGLGNVNSVQFNPVPVGSNVQVVKNVPVSNIGNIGNIGNNVLTTNLANNNLIANSVGSNIIGANFNTGNLLNNGYVNANVPVNLANGFNINTGTFAVGNTGLAAILPNGQPCGIQILADALEVGGAVAVNGQLPFYTTININGQLPSSGYGVVQCGCA